VDQGCAVDPLRRLADAFAPRTLVDVFTATVERFPDEPAIDDGTPVTYRELQRAAVELAERLAAAGIGPGSRVGLRIPSGTTELYLAVLGALHAGAAYVPVDADDPEERAAVIFDEADVDLVLTAGLHVGATEVGTPPARTPGLGDDAWIIFTSGSTGLPKGVAVTHRSAAAFVDAEAELFLVDDPIGPGDRVLAGLSVAFDASCEEMWLAWRYGACLVPAPRSLVRSGMDLGPWLAAERITVVSTVPTLAGLWPDEALDQVRLLIFGGEACPPALVARVAADEREVWNTYGPTEATVVACAARLEAEGPVRIGLPLAGWDLAVVDGDGRPVAPGETGELVIGGVGLARYLDAEKDADRFAPMPTLGWDRAYRSGDLVVHDPEGLLFVGRVDEQVKLGGRRIELGEVDAALQALPGVSAAAAAVRTTAVGGQVLVGYLAAAEGFDLPAAAARLREALPAALVPVLAVVDDLPTRTSGKVDRAALPWPLPGAGGADVPDGLSDQQTWVAEAWAAVLGTAPSGADDDFFELGGGSLTAAQLVSAIRVRHPGLTVADVYAYPRLAAMAEHLAGLGVADDQPDPEDRDWVLPTSRRSQLLLSALTLAIQTLVGARWLVWLSALTNLLARDGDVPWVRPVSWWWVAAGWLLLISPLGRMAVTVAGARLLLLGVEPGEHPKGGQVHVRVWAADKLMDAVGAVNLSGAPWITTFGRLLGNRIGRRVDLHSLPPVTGLLAVGDGASIEPEVDLAGYWLDGDRLILGATHVGAGAAVGSRSTLLPGAHVGDDAEIEPGSAVVGAVPPGERWSGSPARRAGRPRRSWPDHAPDPAGRWLVVFGLSSAAMALLPVVAALAAALVLRQAVRGTADLGDATVAALLATPAATVAGFATLVALILIAVRLLGLGVRAGTYPVRSRIGWQVWATERLLDAARTLLFPLYASLATPVWLRALGAKVGRDVEASTVLLLPSMTTVADGAFLADDTMVASYELNGGWLRIRPAKVGKRAFLGNSGMAAGGRSVPRDGLVAVLSAAPKKSKAGSSWLGSPPVRLRRTVDAADDRRTFHPPSRLRWARAAIELCRVVPLIATVAIAVGVLAALQGLVIRFGHGTAALASGVVLVVAGLVAAATTTAAKWLVVGRLEAAEHPLWSSFVWRNEVVDTFVEMVAAPWFATATAGTPMLSFWLRSLGARIGRGVWCETYWLPEADLVRLGNGVSVNRGCVLQTHLFHDRVMRLGTVDLDHGATMGPHGVILPAASIGADATVGPSSLVMRGEHVPAGTRWAGNPIAPWPAEVGGADTGATA
jgi:non-ribosomal peptide synthetase-like protein